MKKIVLVAMAFGLGIESSRAYQLEGQIWNVGAIGIVMNLNATQYRLTNPRNFPLTDGSHTYQQVYWGIAADWNQYLLRFQIAPWRGSNPSGGAFGDGINNISFATTAFGSKLDRDTLAITDYYFNPSTNFFIEANTIYNANIRWNSYRGGLYSRAVDIRRVMLHETGHMIGLDHPDQAGQQVNSIMNSAVSNTDDLTYDDVTGAQSLYGERATPPPEQPYNPNGVEED